MRKTTRQFTIQTFQVFKIQENPPKCFGMCQSECAMSLSSLNNHKIFSRANNYYLL